MRVLLITETVYPDLNANSEIVFRIGRALKQQYNCDVNILGYTKRATQESIDNPYGVNTILVNTLSSFNRIMESGESKVKRFIKMLMHPNCLRFYKLYTSKPYNEAVSGVYYRAIRNSCKNVIFDCIIGFQAPMYVPMAMSKLNTNVPIIIYKLDPWQTQSVFDNSPEEADKENRADSTASAIIMTDLIFRDYSKFYSDELLKKCHILNFPNIIKYNTDNHNLFDKKSINCIFAGTLYKNIRDPKYTFSLFEKVLGCRIVLHLFGSQVGDIYDPVELPSNIIIHGKVSSDEIISYIASSDVCVNIGNTEIGMMPSKILTYIAIGKPILNIIKDPNCPTLPYMEKYPLGLSVLETPVPTEEDVARVRDFIMTNKGKQISFETIKELYYDCTPEYVGGKVYEIICKVVEENKRSKNK